MFFSPPELVLLALLQVVHRIVGVVGQALSHLNNIGLDVIIRMEFDLLDQI